MSLAAPPQLPTPNSQPPTFQLQVATSVGKSFWELGVGSWKLRRYHAGLDRPMLGQSPSIRRGYRLCCTGSMAKATNRQTSNKAGVASLGKKQDSTRHGFRAEPAARKVAGASGQEDRVRGAAGESAGAARGGKGAALRKMKAARNR